MKEEETGSDVKYYGRMDFKCRKYKGIYYPLCGEAREIEGIEISGRVGSEAFCHPIHVNFEDSLTSHYTYFDKAGKERVFRLRMDFVSPESRDASDLARKAVHGEEID